MILKILVVIWFFKVLINLFTNNYIGRTIFTTMGQKTQGIDNNDYDKLDEEQKTSLALTSVTLIAYAIWKCIIFFIDFVMMLSMLKYDPTIFTLVFLILTLINFIDALLKAKINKNKKNNKTISDAYFENADNLNKFTLTRFICKLINILYWGYAVYLLFF